jgi:very-short-patch-repair endonuclease
MRIRGIIHRADLPGHGISLKQLEEWLQSGAVKSMQPWYLTSEAPADLVSILRTGTRPTCLDAAALHGLWVPPSLNTVHVFRPRQGRGRRSAGRGRTTGLEAAPAPRATPVRRRKGEIVWGSEKSLPLSHHGPALRTWPNAYPVPDLSLVLEHAARCLPLSQAATLFESALERQDLGRREAERVIAALPHRLRRGLARIRSDAGSGTETTVRWWFESLGVAVSTQVAIAGVGRVDLLLGQSWVIECDSREFHDDPEQYARDRARDLALQALGYRVTRLTWKQVFVTWASTEERLLRILRRADHLRPPDPGLSLTA